MEIWILRIVKRIAPAYARARAFDYWLRLLNQQTALELRGMKGGLEWREIAGGIDQISELKLFCP